MDNRKEIAEKIIAALTNRSGFNDLWYNLDEEIQTEITDEIVNILPIHDVMLRCTKDLFMYSGERIFTKGKIYKEVYPDKGSAIDDKGDEHILSEWDEFFIAI